MDRPVRSTARRFYQTAVAIKPGASPFSLLHARSPPSIMPTMEISIDGSTVDLDVRDLDGALEAANRHLSTTGRIVVEVEADGRVLMGDDLEAARTSGVLPAELVLQSADPRDLASEALEHVRVGLQEASRLQVEAAESLQRDDLPTAMERIRTVVDHWQNVQQVVMQVGSLIDGDIGTIRVGATSVEDAVTGLAERLRALRTLLGDRDTVGLADELMYIWPEVCTQWDAMLRAIIDVVNGHGPGRDTRHAEEATS